MARTNIQIVELDFASGILSHSTGYEIGPKMRRCANLGWRPQRHPDDVVKRGLAFLPTAATSPQVSFADSLRVLGLGMEKGGDGAFTGVAAVQMASSNLGLYALSTGALLLDTGVFVSNVAQSAPAVYWTGIETPAVYVSHPDTGEVWKGTESDGFAVYAPANDPGDLFKGNSDLIVHLDRLWLARINTETSAMDSQVWFADPFDQDTIRPTSYIFIPDNVRAIFRPGAIDAGTPQLVMAGDRAVHVLDGDPFAGNAGLRRISYSVGIADRSLVAETPLGAITRATDSRFYAITPGAASLTPLPGSPEDLSGNFDANTGTDLTDSLAWSPPYVYYCIQDAQNVWVLDLRDQPKWFGPLSYQKGGIDPTASFPGRFNPITPGADNVTAPLYFSTFTSAGPGQVFKLTPTNPVPEGRQSSIRTGYLYVPDHRVEARRVTLECVRSFNDFEVIVKVTRSNGTATIVRRTVPSTPMPNPDILAKIVFDFSSDPVVSDFCFLDITFPVGQEPGLTRGNVEIRIQPLAD